MPDFLEIHESPSDALRGIVSRAAAMKSAREGRPRGAPDDCQALAGQLVALVFEKPSTRTRVSVDVAVRQLGGQTILLSGGAMHLGRSETVADTARVLSRYVDLIMIRTHEHANLRELAEHSAVPVINGLTNRSHPCQVMADIMTFQESRGPIEGKQVAWLGPGNNVCGSFLQAAGKFGFDLTFSGPAEFDPDPEFVEFARAAGAGIEFERDPSLAVRTADLIVTDVWDSMHDAATGRERRHELLHPYQVNSALLECAPPEAIFMHCLPAHRGDEVTSEVLDGPQSVAFDEAENRMHVQKAILRWCLDL